MRPTSRNATLGKHGKTFPLSGYLADRQQRSVLPYKSEGMDGRWNF